MSAIALITSTNCDGSRMKPEDSRLSSHGPFSRIFLDNFENVQVSWLTVGLKVGQVGLRFGVNDMGSIMIEENVISAAGARNRANDVQLRRVIQDAGFIPRQRTTLYERYVN